MPFSGWNPRSIPQRLADILIEIESARNFVAGKTLQEFKDDRMLQHAVLYALQTISEAAARIDDLERERGQSRTAESIIARYPKLPWQEIFALVNVYRHDYGAIDVREVWDTVTGTELEHLEQMLRIELPLAFAPRE